MGRPAIDMTGQRYGFLRVVERADTKNKGARWRCLCDCGKEAVVRRSSLLAGQRSCGCLERYGWTMEEAARRNVKEGHVAHGHSQDRRHSRTYSSWHHMKQRCTNPNNHRYSDYGGRGIGVCDRWARFENFLTDMGERPEGLTLDRVDNEGHYEPGNCRWATRSEQDHNKRRRKRLQCAA